MMSESITSPPVPAEPTVEDGAPDTGPNYELALQLLEEWSQGDNEDEQDQRETWEYLKRVLDEDRWSARKLFP